MLERDTVLPREQLRVMLRLVLAGDKLDLPRQFQKNFAFVVDEESECRAEPHYKSKNKCTHRMSRASKASIRNPRP